MKKSLLKWWGVLLIAMLALSVSFVGCSDDDDDDDDDGGGKEQDVVVDGGKIVYTHFMICPDCVTETPDIVKQYYKATANGDEYTYTFTVKANDGWSAGGIAFKILKVSGADVVDDDWTGAFGGAKGDDIAVGTNNSEANGVDLVWQPSSKEGKPNALITGATVGDKLTIHVKVDGEDALAWVTKSE